MKILIAGDFCPQHRIADKFAHDDFASVLKNVKPVVESADYSIVNFECSITKGGEKPIVKLGPNLHCSEKGMEGVKWAGFNCVTLANNHFLDYGTEGVKNTLAVCRELGIDTVGGGMNLQEASAILYKEICGNTLAVVNCCEHEFSIATETTAGSNPLNPIQQYYAIKEARTKADFVLVIVHGGHEHYQLPSPRMVETYRFFVDAGADAVVNHHQHRYSGYETYKGKPIFYGLGNFCFDLRHIVLNKKWNYGYLAEIDFSKEDIHFQLYPYKQCSGQAQVELLPKESFDTRFDELNSIIADKNKLIAATEKYYESSANNSSSIFEPIQNRYYLECKRRGFLPSLISKKRKLRARNIICCEAHRDKLLWYLNSNKR